MNLNDITISQGLISKISYNYEPVIIYDETSIDGTTRHWKVKFINDVPQFDKVFVLNIVDVSDTERTDLLAIDGSNNVTFQAYSGMTTYICNCSLYEYKYIEGGQELPSFNITLTVTSIYEPTPTAIDSIIFTAEDGEVWELDLSDDSFTQLTSTIVTEDNEKIDFVDESNAMIITSAMNAYITDDIAATWNLKGSLDGTITSLFVLTSSIAFVTKQGGTNPGLYKTTDNGLNWTLKHSSTTTYAVRFDNMYHGVLSKYGDNLETFDTGETWS